MEDEKKQRIFVDHDEKKYLILVAEDGIRTTLSLQHDDGLALLRELTLYYGKPMTVAPQHQDTPVAPMPAAPQPAPEVKAPEPQPEKTTGWPWIPRFW